MDISLSDASIHLQRAYWANPDAQEVEALAAGWNGAPEALATAAMAMQLLPGTNSAGRKTWALPADTAAGLKAQIALQTDVRAIARSTPTQPPAAAATRPAPPSQTKAPSPAVAAPKEPDMDRYDDRQVRERVQRIFGSSASRGAERLALSLVNSEMTVDQAIQTLRIAKGEDTYRAAAPVTIDAEAIYRRRNDASARYRAEHMEHATHPMSAQHVFAANEKANYRDPLDASAIYARRNAQSRGTVIDPSAR
jgi:hypothetical protein